MRNISAKLFLHFIPVLFDITLVSKYSFQIEEIPNLQVSLAEIYKYIMILNSNMIFLAPILEYRKIYSLPNSKLSLFQPVTARKKTNTNLRRNVCELQLQYIPNDDLAFFSLGAVRAVKTYLTLKCCL